MMVVRLIVKAALLCIAILIDLINSSITLLAEAKFLLMQLSIGGHQEEPTTVT